jgi:TonB dependent receptor/Carboxypeptidase regulatory-like domain/TonB-dependent Receptor Plug Domain
MNSPIQANAGALRARLSARTLHTLVALIVVTLPVAAHATTTTSFARRIATDVAGTVSDSVSGRPIGSAQLSIMQGTRVVFNTTTDDFGRYRAHNLSAGTYAVSVHALGFRPLSRPVTVDGTAGTARVDFALTPAVINLAAVEVKASTPLAVNTRTGDQVFKQDDYHGAPTTTTSQILQQSIAGAARAPTGEVHIRGQHAEYTYYVDGVPVPSGISGSLNELFDPEVVNQITFQTGGWDAEYGNKNLAIVNVATKIPAGGFHADAAAYGGSFNSNGQSLSMSTNVGRLGLFASGARQVTEMRREPVAFDTATFEPFNIHNHGEDLFTFGKASYSASNSDVVNLDANWSRTRFQIPFDPAETSVFDDNQQDVNSFVNLGWRHQYGSTSEMAPSGEGAPARGPSELFVGLFYRYGSLNYTPGVNDEPQFFFFPDTVNAYNLRETRSFSTGGIKLDFTTHPQHELELKAGVLAQTTSGNEDFRATTQTGAVGPASTSKLNGSDVGGYAQIAYAPTEKIELRTGARYDAHTAPFAGTTNQLSPRIRLNFFPSPATTLYAYYGRLFVPTNVEELRTITNATLGDAAQPTLPERDHFFEVGLVHRFPVAGLVTKLSGYHKVSSPGIDDATIPGTAIVTSVNLDKVWTNGIEGVLEIRPNGPLSGYVNASVIHAYGQAPITGGFLPADAPVGYFDLDHDQRISVVASGTYSANRLFVSATAIYGSGLTNGNTPEDFPDIQFGTGLFAMNRYLKVDPSTIVNASAGYTIIAGGTVVRPQVYVENLFDQHYLLKGAFFSGAQVGRPRSVQLRVNLGV